MGSEDSREGGVDLCGRRWRGLLLASIECSDKRSSWATVTAINIGAVCVGNIRKLQNTATSDSQRGGHWGSGMSTSPSQCTAYAVQATITLLVYPRKVAKRNSEPSHVSGLDAALRVLGIPRQLVTARHPIRRKRGDQGQGQNGHNNAHDSIYKLLCWEEMT